MTRDWWQKGRGLDLWSIPHFLFGLLGGLVPFLFDISIAYAFVLMIGLAVVWEIFEKVVGLKETFQNILIDLILPCIAFVFTTRLLQIFPLHYHDLLVIGGAVLLIYLFTNISGWRAYRRRQREFTN